MCSTKKKVITHYKPLGGFADGNKLEEILQVNLEVMTQFFSHSYWENQLL